MLPENKKASLAAQSILLPSQQVAAMDDQLVRTYLQQLLSTSTDLFILVDQELRIQLFNDQAYKQAVDFFNMEVKPGMSILTLSDPTRHDMLRDIYRKVFLGEHHETVVNLKHKDGNVVVFHNKLRPVINSKGKIDAVLVSISDITQQTLAERQLKESEEKYRLLFSANPLPAWIYDIDTFYFLEVNNAAIQFYGYSREEFLNMRITDIRPKEDLPALYANLKQMGLAKNLERQVWRHMKKNGEMVHMEIYADTILYENKKSRIIMANDVTEKVESEIELIKSNERFLLASKATSDAIWDWDMEKNEMKWGEGLYTLFGYYGKDLGHEQLYDRIHEEDRDMVRQSLEESIQTPEVSIWRKEYRLLHANGRYRHILDHRFIVRNQKKKAVRMIGAMKDITELKEKEKALLFLNERYNLVTRATSDLIWDWNLETGKVYRDETNLEKVYGVSDNSSIKVIGAWIKRIHPDDFDEVQQTVQKILNSREQDTFEIEYRFMMDNGKYAHIFDRGYIMRRENNEPYRMIGAAQNISERKRLEEKLLKEELNRQKIISQAVIDAQEKERSEISKELHDNVNQVLTTTKLYLDLAASSNELQADLVSKSSANVIYVINEIRQLSRSLLHPSLGDLGLVDSIKDLIESINTTNLLEVTFIGADFDESTLEENQKLMFFRITQEGLNNILKHAEASIATVHIMQDNKKMRLMIRDDGKGFSAKEIKPGAGLNNIRNRVYLFNGEFYIHSSPGKGCELIIDIPIKK